MAQQCLPTHADILSKDRVSGTAPFQGREARGRTVMTTKGAARPQETLDTKGFRVESVSRSSHSVAHGAQIVRFREADMQRYVSKEELGADTHIASELGAAVTADEKSRLLRSMIRAIGFDSMRYFAVRLAPSGKAERIYLMESYLSPPHSLFFDDGHYLHDERFKALMASPLPCVWDIQQLVRLWRSGPGPSSYRDWLTLLHTDGKISGMAFSMRVPGSSLCAVVSLSAYNADASWISDSVLVQAITLGLSVQQRCSAYVRAIDQDVSGGALSELQRRVLALVADGLSDKEIATRLDMTLYNVDYQLRRLREIFGVTNRARLAYMAGRLGVM
jgi:DNA-binding CsgD family transcriptional regulator